MRILIPILLLGLALASAGAYVWGKGKGVAALIALLLAAAIATLMLSSDGGLMVGYGLAFGWPVLFGSLALGALGGALFTRRKFLPALLALLPIVLFGLNTAHNMHNEQSEKDQAFRFVTTHPGLTQLMGGPADVDLSSLISYADSSKGMYVFRIKHASRLYAAVSVDRKWNSVQMRFECVTTSNDVARLEGCKSSPVPLDGATAVVVDKGPDGASTAPAPRAFLPRFPASAQVHVIGVHESGNAVAATTGTQASKGRVKVELPYSTTPLILVLSSHEPVEWHIANKGRSIASILVSGPHPPEYIAGASEGITNIGIRSAYEIDSPDYLKLKDIVVRNTRLPTMQFQGARSGTSFTVPPN